MSRKRCPNCRLVTPHKLDRVRSIPKCIRTYVCDICFRSHTEQYMPSLKKYVAT